MRLVEGLDEILSNLIWLDRVRETGNFNQISIRYREYQDFIRRGTCFIAYQTGGHLAFAPSRFVGYVRNNFTRHAANSQRHGSDTNRRISSILDMEPTAADELERLYTDFCAEIGVAPEPTGRFGHPRRYWDIRHFPNISELGQDKALFDDPDLPETEKLQLILARRGQGKFRSDLFTNWTGKCCVTGCTVGQVLRASHIKPWSLSSNQERLDPDNGLLLAANVDALFDCGLISFQDDGSMLLSSAIDREEFKRLGIPADDVKINVSRGARIYLKHHRDHVFKN